MPQRFIAGVDLGGTSVRVAITNDEGEIEARRSWPVPRGEPAKVLDGIGRAIDELVRGVWPAAKVAAIGVAMPGAVNPASGTGSSLANLPGWDHVDVAEALARPRGVPIAVENDANAAAAGEGWLGAARGASTHVFVAYGTGIGAGLVVDGWLHGGAHRLAGEVGFMPMTRAHVRAPDWRQGLEGAIGGRAIGERAALVFGEGAGAGALFDAAASGDAEACAWLSMLTDYLAMALCDVIAVLDPEVVVLGGGVAIAQGERLLAPVRELVHARAAVRTRIVLTELGEDAQILGAVRLAIDKLEGGTR